MSRPPGHKSARPQLQTPQKLSVAEQGRIVSAPISHGMRPTLSHGTKEIVSSSGHATLPCVRKYFYHNELGPSDSIEDGFFDVARVGSFANVPSIPSVHDLRDLSITTPLSEVVLVDRTSDRVLCDVEERCLHEVNRPGQSVVDQVRVLAEQVSARMGGTATGHTVAESVKDVERVRNDLLSHVIPISRLHIGFSSSWLIVPRSLHGLSGCEAALHLCLVSSSPDRPFEQVPIDHLWWEEGESVDTYHATNYVRVPKYALWPQKEGTADETEVEAIVDLLYAPGRLYDPQSPEGQQYHLAEARPAVFMALRHDRPQSEGEGQWAGESSSSGGGDRLPVAGVGARGSAAHVGKAKRPSSAGAAQRHLEPVLEQRSGSASHVLSASASAAEALSGLRVGLGDEYGGSHGDEIDFNHLDIRKLVGHGGFGDVYRAKWRDTDVAVKKLHQTDIDVSLLVKEVSLIRRLRHPNILLYMGLCTEPPNLAIVTEYMHGGDLYRILHPSPSKRAAADATPPPKAPAAAPNTPQLGGSATPGSVAGSASTPSSASSSPRQLPRKRRLALALDVASGMNFLHQCTPPIIHCDLKSLNVLIGRNWKAVVSDFGLSRVRKESFINTTTGAGSPAWMGPETMRGEPFNEKADVYSFGVVLWELVTQDIPYAGLHPMQIVGMVGFGGHRLGVPEGVCGFPSSIGEMMHACWRDDPKERPTFREMIVTLKEALRVVRN